SRASHRLKIDNAERFVDSRANEYRCVRVKFAGGLLVHHFLDPDDTRPLRFCPLHCGPPFFRHARRIRRGGAKHDLKIAFHEWDRAYEMLKPFLASNPADEKHIRSIWIDAVWFERSS